MIKKIGGNKMIAAIYSRKSKFTGVGESIDNQIEMCKEYARTHLENITDFNFLHL